LAVEEIKYVINETSLESPLRAIFVDHFCAMDIGKVSSSHRLLQYPKEFLAEMMKQRARLSGYQRGVAEAAQRINGYQRSDVITNIEASKKRKRDN
jgi:hypothetical protein